MTMGTVEPAGHMSLDGAPGASLQAPGQACGLSRGAPWLKALRLGLS